MEKYAFVTQNGFCPACIAFGKIWYIKDRYVGGNEYEYCLMSKPKSNPIQQKFKNKKDIARWLNNDSGKAEYDDTKADYIISRQIRSGYNFSDKAMVKKDNDNYIYDKVKNTVTVVVESQKETGWFDSYHECLKNAKEILTSLEYQQLTLDLF